MIGGSGRTGDQFLKCPVARTVKGSLLAKGVWPQNEFCGQFCGQSIFGKTGNLNPKIAAFHKKVKVDVMLQDLRLNTTL